MAKAPPSPEIIDVTARAQIAALTTRVQTLEAQVAKLNSDVETLKLVVSQISPGAALALTQTYVVTGN